MNGPLVTAICPTLWTPRKWCLPLAARALGAQEIEPPLVAFLVGVDQEVFDDRRSYDFMEQHLAPRRICSVRLVPCPSGETLGHRRNRLVQAAETEWIAHWDDDDWKAPGNLATAIRVAEAANADIVGTRRAFFYDLHTARAWRYGTISARLLVGTSLVYRREVALRVPFQDVTRGEDTRFLHDAHLQGARITCYPGDVVAFQHGQTTGRDWPPREPEYQEAKTAEVAELMGDQFREWMTGYAIGSAPPV